MAETGLFYVEIHIQVFKSSSWQQSAQTWLQNMISSPSFQKRNENFAYQKMVSFSEWQLSHLNFTVYPELPTKHITLHLNIVHINWTKWNFTSFRFTCYQYLQAVKLTLLASCYLRFLLLMDLTLITGLKASKYIQHASVQMLIKKEQEGGHAIYAERTQRSW